MTKENTGIDISSIREEKGNDTNEYCKRLVNMKEFIKYGSRIVFGLLVLFMGLLTYYAYTPDESYHHCEAGQNDGNPIYVVLMAVASLIVFCIVLYKTKDCPSEKERKDKPIEIELPEPYKTYVDFDKYMSELVWVIIENETETAPQSGFYLFKCLGDNNTFYEFYELDEKDKLCKYYLDHHFDGWTVVRPIAYHIVEDAEGEYLMKNWECNDNSMTFAPQNDEPIRLADGKLYKDGELLRFEKGFKWIKADSLLELRKIASRNKCQRIKNIQQIEEVNGIAESFGYPAKGKILWRKCYWGLIECSKKEKELLITNLDPNNKQLICKLQVHKNKGHLFIWRGNDDQYFYVGNVPLEAIKDKVEEDVYDERFKCKNDEMCKFLEKMEQYTNYSFTSY